MKNESKFKKLIRHRIVIGLLVCLICGVTVWSFYIIQCRNTQRRREGHIKARILSRFQNLAISAHLIAADSGKQPPEQIEEFLEFLELYISSTREHMDEEGWIDSHTGLFIDSYRNPVKLVVKSPNQYMFVSSGPNGKDENGEGDDIVYTFNPWD